MVRKSNSKRLQIYNRVRKHKIRSTDQAGLIDTLEGIISSDDLSWLYETAGNWFRFFGRICSKLYLVPYSFDHEGKLRIFSQRQLRIHYTVLSVMALSMIHKSVALCYRISSTDSALTAEISTFICVASVLFYLVPLAVAVSVLLKREETVCVLNTWNELLASLRPGNENGGIFCDTQGAFVVMSLSEVCVIGSLGFSLLGFIFESLPVTYFTATEALRLVDTMLMPRILWKLVFWPLELLTYMSPALPCAWAHTINDMIAITMKNCLEQLR